jgi:MoaA/NifB/PqqE/SkfB family radical SAM enzyme
MSTVYNRMRDFTLEHAVDQVVKLAAIGSKKNPDRTLRRMLKLCTMITSDPLWSKVVEGVYNRLDSNHPAMDVARKFFTHLNPKARSALVRNLFVRETLLGANLRHAIEDDLGYYPPSTMVISPSMKCPLNCYGCYAGSYTKAEELSFDEVDDLVQQAKDIGIFFIVISGGEPFAWPGLLDLFEKHPDCMFQVYTSGLLFDDEKIDRLAKAGNVIPCVSCEGFEAETDKRRGKGAFKKVMAAMDRLKEHGVLVAFSATVTRENADLITSDAFIEHHIENGCLLGWYFIYMPIGREPKLELMPTPEQRVEMSHRIKRHRATKGIFLVDFWNDGEHTRGCIAGGRKYFHVNNVGDVEPCVFCHYAEDNIRDKPLREALNGRFFRAMRAEQPYNADCRRPCFMIDNPATMRKVVGATGARPTHEGADTLVTIFADELDRYADEFGKALEDGPVSDTTYQV